MLGATNGWTPHGVASVRNSYPIAIDGLVPVKTGAFKAIRVKVRVRVRCEH